MAQSRSLLLSSFRRSRVLEVRIGQLDTKIDGYIKQAQTTFEAADKLFDVTRKLAENGMEMNAVAMTDLQDQINDLNKRQLEMAMLLANRPSPTYPITNGAVDWVEPVGGKSS